MCIRAENSTYLLSSSITTLLFQLLRSRSRDPRIQQNGAQLETRIGAAEISSSCFPSHLSVRSQEDRKVFWLSLASLIGKVDHPWPVRTRSDVSAFSRSAYKCGPLTIFPSVIYTCLLLVSAGGTSQIIPREKTRTKIETRRSCRRERVGEREKKRERKRMTRRRRRDRGGEGGQIKTMLRNKSPLFNLREFSLS